MLLSISYLFLLGLIVGSFLNVVILRYHTGKSLSGRSGCFSCRHQLGWAELVPVVSFLWQGGRCRHCGSKISRQYPLVELLTGVLLALTAWKFYPDYLAIGYVGVILATLVMIVVYDLRHQIIPDGPAYLFIALAILSPFALHLGVGLPSDSGVTILYHLIAGLVLFTVFFSIWYFSRGKAMGFGDAKLAFAIGALFGLKAGANAVILAFWLGALVGLGLIALSRTKIKLFGRRFSFKSEVPFAPFLVLGLILQLFWGLSVIGF